MMTMMMMMIKSCKLRVGRRRGVMKVDDDQDNDDYPKVMTFQRRAAKDNDD